MVLDGAKQGAHGGHHIGLGRLLEVIGGRRSGLREGRSWWREQRKETKSTQVKSNEPVRNTIFLPVHSPKSNTPYTMYMYAVTYIIIQHKFNLKTLFKILLYDVRTYLP